MVNWIGYMNQNLMVIGFMDNSMDINGYVMDNSWI